MKYEKVITADPEEDMDVCRQFHGNPSSGCWHISVVTTAVDQHFHPQSHAAVVANKHYTVWWFVFLDVKVCQSGCKKKKKLVRVTLTWPFLRCSWVQRRQSSGWLPPNWSRPPPQSDRSPGSWRRQLRDKLRIYSNSSTVCLCSSFLYLSPHKPNSVYKSPFLAARRICSCQESERQVGQWSISFSELTSGWHLVYKAKAFSVWINIPAIPVCCSSFCDRLHKDAQLLQAHVSTCTHPDDTDAQTIAVWKWVWNTRPAVTTQLP